jgi:predicted HicB family RNase H-like nuclease
MTMQHGPYVAIIEYDEDEELFRGRVANLARDGFDFYGRDVDELRTEFARSAETYEAFCREQGIEPEKPYSGQFLVRATPEVHRAVALAALRSGKSMNVWAVEALERAASGFVSV